MEILILGVLLVALMVYVSTKIKKNAAQAFEREIIETEDFTLVKPEGFINPIDENSKYAFEAHSKAYGENQEHHVWQASADLSVAANSDFDDFCRAAGQSVDKILSEKILTDSLQDQKVCLLEGEKTENEIPFSVYRKIVADSRAGKIYDLKISVLQSYREQYADKTSEMLDSFILK
jgi:hypothetical protein